MTSNPTLRLNEPADVAAAVPYLLGFHPADSLVVLGMTSRPETGRRIIFSARFDLASDATGLAREIAVIVGRQRRVDSALLVGYGPLEPVLEGLDACQTALRVPVAAAIRVTDGRCYCALCDECLPSEGVPLAVDRSRVAAEATYHGLTVLPDRAALVRSVSPVGGLQPIAMSQAVERADARLLKLISAAATENDPFAGQVLRRAGVLAVDDALAAARNGTLIDDDALAWLTLLLESLAVRDHAWESTDHEPWQVRFWLDATRRAHPELVAAPATILAFSSWRGGDGAVAGVALDRALACDPYYSLALLLREAMHTGVSPEALGGWPLERPPRQRRRRTGRRIMVRP